jgi:hypothetical protein
MGNYGASESGEVVTFDRGTLVTPEQQRHAPAPPPAVVSAFIVLYPASRRSLFISKVSELEFEVLGHWQKYNADEDIAVVAYHGDPERFDTLAQAVEALGVNRLVTTSD